MELFDEPRCIVHDAQLEVLTDEECRAQLRSHAVGRIAVVVDGFPVVLPVNYRLMEQSGLTWIAIRTRPDNVLDRASMHVAFEIDDADPPRREGWSVLARGTLHRVDPDAADFRAQFGPDPWVQADRDRWLIVQPFSISGRRLHAAETEWAFGLAAYL